MGGMRRAPEAWIASNVGINQRRKCLALSHANCNEALISERFSINAEVPKIDQKSPERGDVWVHLGFI